MTEDREWTMLPGYVAPVDEEVPAWWPPSVPIASGLPRYPRRHVAPAVVVSVVNLYGGTRDRARLAVERCAREGVEVLEGLRSLGGEKVLRDTAGLWRNEDCAKPRLPRPQHLRPRFRSSDLHDRLQVGSLLRR